MVVWILLVVLFTSYDTAAALNAESQNLLGSSSTTLATFNTALVPFYPEFETRTDIIIEKISELESDVDIWCLQEVYFADVHKKIYNAVKDYYPYALSAIDLTVDSESEEPACSPAMLDGLIVCWIEVLQTTCAPGKVPKRDQVGCGIKACTPLVLSTLSDSCRRCASLAGNEVSDFKRCLVDPASRYIPTYGLIMLSKRELTDTNVEGFIPQSQYKGFLQATVKDVGNLVCTHASAILGDIFWGPPITLPPLYESYDEQQYAELLRLFDVLVNLEEPILLGDFNHGPALSKNITWWLPFHYGLMASRGLVSPYVHLDGRCTWCGRGENAAAAATIPLDGVLDHIYLLPESLERVESVERILEGLTTPSGIPISDHYGVKMTLTDYTRDCSLWYYYYYCKPEPASILKLSPPQKQLQGLCKAV